MPLTSAYSPVPFASVVPGSSRSCSFSQAAGGHAGQTVGHGATHRAELGRGADQSRRFIVAMSASLPAASASVHHAGANSSRTMRPPAASAASTRASACSGGTQTAMWIAPPPSRAANPSTRTRRPARAARVDEILVGTVAARLVPEDGAPERHYRSCVGRARDDEQGLDHRRVDGDAQLACGRRDLAGELDVAPAHAVRVLADGDEPYGHAVLPNVDIGRVSPRGQPARRCHRRNWRSPRTNRSGRRRRRRRSAHATLRRPRARQTPRW